MDLDWISLDIHVDGFWINPWLGKLAAGRWSTAAPSCECAAEFGILYLDWMVYFRLEYASSGSLAIGRWLADLNTTVIGLAMGTLVVIVCCVVWRKRMVLGKWEVSMFGGSFGTGKYNLKITGFERTNLQVGVLWNCWFVWFRDRVCI
jgi:hypothetical protein